MIDDLRAQFTAFLEWVIIERREHDDFFQQVCGIGVERARWITNHYVAACVHLGNDPGFGGVKTKVFVRDWRFDDEFAKAGLGTVVRNRDGGTNIKLRTANHLEGKRNAREAMRNMAPSRRSAITTEINKLMGMPSQAWNYSAYRFVSVGVRG